MKKQTFALNGNILNGTRSLHLQKMEDGRFLVFARNFAFAWAILRTASLVEATKHFNEMAFAWSVENFKELDGAE